MIRTVILELDLCEDCPYHREYHKKSGDLFLRCGHHMPERRISDSGVPRWCPLPTEKQYLGGKRD